MNGEGHPCRRIRLLATLAGTVAAITTVGAPQVAVGHPEAPPAAVIEIVPLDKDQWALVLPGSPKEEPLQVEIKKEGTVFSGWALSNPAPTDPSATRWSKAWQQVLGAKVQQQDLWSEALARIDKEPLPPGVARMDPNLHLILRSTGEDPRYLSIVESHAINQSPAGWEKAGDIDIDSALSIPSNNRKTIWNLLFGQDQPATKDAWPLFWNSWIESARKDPSKHLFVYRGADGNLVRLIRERIEEADWQQRMVGSYTPPVEPTSSSTQNPQDTTLSQPKPGWRPYLLYLGILLILILAALAILRYRAKIAKRFVTWLARRLSSQNLPSLVELIEMLHTAALESLNQDPVLEPELEVRPQALAFARKRMIAVAEAGTVSLPALQLPQVDNKTAARQKEEADLGRELLNALRKRGSKATFALAQDYLTFLLGLEDQLASERQAAKKLQEEKQRIESDWEKGQSWLAERSQFEADLKASRLKHNELNTRLATVTSERNSFEQRAQNLQAQIEQERREQETARIDKRVLDEKLTRIRLASDYLRKTNLAYWDRCRHPASAAALLYNGYLGLFQVAYGAARKESLMETAGWMNLRNLLRRVGQVPGLETWEQGFGRGVYPDIDAVQISEAFIVDRNQQDRERTVQSTVLRSLLNGDVQLGGALGEHLDLNKLLGWPLFFKVEDGRVWGAV